MRIVGFEPFPVDVVTMTERHHSRVRYAWSQGKTRKKKHHWARESQLHFHELAAHHVEQELSWRKVGWHFGGALP